MESLLRKIIVPALVPNRFQIIKLKEFMERSFNAPGKMYLCKTIN